MTPASCVSQARPQVDARVFSSGRPAPVSLAVGLKQRLEPHFLSDESLDSPAGQHATERSAELSPEGRNQLKAFYRRTRERERKGRNKR